MRWAHLFSPVHQSEHDEIDRRIERVIAETSGIMRSLRGSLDRLNTTIQDLSRKEVEEEDE